MDFPNVYPYSMKGRQTKMMNPDWRIGTMDLETYVVGGISKTYALGFYVKDSMNTFYIDKDLNSDSLILMCLDAMLIDKYNGYTFYIHNLERYDVYFIFRVLVKARTLHPEIYDFKLNFRNDGIIGLKIFKKVKTKTFNIRIVDSLNLLNSSLDKLCKTFDTKVKKSLFPYEFVKENTIFYNGDKPKLDYYLTNLKYKGLNRDWSTCW